MPISSRTPEGDPLRCQICGEVASVEVADAGDTLCPACGSLLWEFKNHFAVSLNVPFTEIDLETLERDFASDSLDVVEVMLSIEEKWGHLLDEDDLGGIKTFRELVALIRRRQREQSEDSTDN